MQVGGQVAQESPDFVTAHLAGMAPVMETDVAEDPLDISLLGAKTVVTELDLGSDDVEKGGGTDKGSRMER